MDEVHLYAGTIWRPGGLPDASVVDGNASQVEFRGASQTLANGRSFFASLTGLSESVVQEIRPDENDMVQEGAEYLLALRRPGVAVCIVVHDDPDTDAGYAPA